MAQVSDKKTTGKLSKPKGQEGEKIRPDDKVEITLIDARFGKPGTVESVHPILAKKLIEKGSYVEGELSAEEAEAKAAKKPQKTAKKSDKPETGNANDSIV